MSTFPDNPNALLSRDQTAKALNGSRVPNQSENVGH